MVKDQTETFIKGAAPGSLRFPVSDQVIQCFCASVPSSQEGVIPQQSHTQRHRTVPRVYFGGWVWDFNSALSLWVPTCLIQHQERFRWAQEASALWLPLIHSAVVPFLCLPGAPDLPLMCRTNSWQNNHDSACWCWAPHSKGDSQLWNKSTWGEKVQELGYTAG